MGAGGDTHTRRESTENTKKSQFGTFMRSATRPTKVWMGPPVGCLTLCVEGVESQAASGGAASVEKCDILSRLNLNSRIFKGQRNDAYALDFNLRKRFSDRKATLGKDMCWGVGVWGNINSLRRTSINNSEYKKALLFYCWVPSSPFFWPRPFLWQWIG